MNGFVAIIIAFVIMTVVWATVLIVLYGKFKIDKRVSALVAAVLAILAGGIFVQATDAPLTTQFSVNGHEFTLSRSDNEIETPKPPQGDLVRVTEVIDGDTIEVAVSGGTNERVRLIGIDTPEVRDPRTTVECFGREASAKMHELLDGRLVKLESDSVSGDRDKYDRLLRYTWRDDGLFVNYEMILQGYAYEYTYDLPYQYQGLFNEAERIAREDRRGLWAAETCNGQRNNRFGPVGPDDKDCKDFSTQAEAQAYFASKGGSATNNVDNLDGDGDGRVCETLP